MQYLKTKLIAAALIAGVAGTTALPAMADRDGPRRLDVDGDGFISLEEFRFPETRMLMRADADGDGSVTQAEINLMREEMAARNAERMAEHQQRADEQFQAMDTNGDGAVTADEARSHAFGQIDTDGDQLLSRQELRDGMRHHDRPRGPRGDRDGHHEMGGFGDGEGKRRGRGPGRD